MDNGLVFLGGGPPPVIDGTLLGIISAWKEHTDAKLYGARNGVLGWLFEDLVDINEASRTTDLSLLRQSPGGGFLGSARYQPKEVVEFARMQRMAKVATEHGVGKVFAIGGGDTMSLANRTSDIAAGLGAGFQVMGAVKTVDNDLNHAVNHVCPGYGSFAKFVKQAAFGVNQDNYAVKTNDPGLVIEWMGRYNGWGAAAAAMGTPELFEDPDKLAPQIIILGAERPQSLEAIEDRVRDAYGAFGRFIIHMAEGAEHPTKGPYKKGQMITGVSGMDDGFYLNEELDRRTADDKATDWSGHVQMGGVAESLARYLEARMDVKVRPGEYHGLVQRSSIFAASEVDANIAYAVGWNAVKHAFKGESGTASVVDKIEGLYSSERTVAIGELTEEHGLSPEMIAGHGFGVTPAFLDYALSLTKGSIDLQLDEFDNPLLPVISPESQVVKKCEEYDVLEWSENMIAREA